MRVTAAAVLAGSLLTVPAQARAATGCETLTVPAGFGITCRRVTTPPFQPNLRDVVLTSTAIHRPAGGTPEISPVTRPLTVRIYLPDGYGPSAPPYESLYLRGGGGDGHDAYTAKGDLVTALKNGRDPYQVIAVMPTGGLAGWYSDWPGRTDGFFAPQWETFHVGQLVPWIDANYNTAANRDGRAIAGISMGGFGALRYAAAHPGTFGAVGALSPGTELRKRPAQDIISGGSWLAGAAVDLLEAANGKFKVNKYDADGRLVLDQDEQLLYRLDQIFGPHAEVPPNGTRETTYDWPQVNPMRMAEQGRYQPYHQRLALYAGGCASLPAAPTGTTPAAPSCAYDIDATDPLDPDKDAEGEPMLGAYVDVLDRKLRAQGIGHRYCYGTGGHEWDDWKANLKDFLRYAYRPSAVGDCVQP
ncbi:alpha/beta hydrolase [Nonomuraea sp. SBT364]|uniref:alpha/beta hydrolase n=1 Tax=Nonomuraea sp. SBT364 TaxID=1580530 RepID=UPI0012E13DEC|nr:alpha/beta hydrolase-fold protein [Nonomuraea sp. SBT364]